VETLTGLIHRLRLRAAPLALLLGALLMAPAAAPAQDAAREYSLKAVFLFNFCQFMDWPPSSFGGASDPIVIGVLGPNPFGAKLQQAVQGEIVRGRPIRVEYYQRLSQARCHILFFGSITARPDEFADLHRRGIATVGETEFFLQQGGMVALIADGSRVRLRINLPAVRSTRIEVSSKLLRVADINR
jgi:hypothetical protein